MKKLFILMAVVSLASLGFVANSHANVSMAQSSFTTYDVHKLIGIEVKNADGVKLGVIKDLVLDSQGRAIFAVLYDRAKVEYGGEHTIGKYVAVPFEALSFSTSKSHAMTVLLDVKKETLDYAPAYHKTDLRNPVWDEGIYYFFGETPYWDERLPVNPILQ